MATIRRQVSALRVQVTEDNEKAISVTLRFNDGTDDYVIDIPDLIQSRLDRLFIEFQKQISQNEDVIRDLFVDKDYNVRLQT